MGIQTPNEMDMATIPGGVWTNENGPQFSALTDERENYRKHLAETPHYIHWDRYFTRRPTISYNNHNNSENKQICDKKFTKIVRICFSRSGQVKFILYLILHAPWWRKQVSFSDHQIFS